MDVLIISDNPERESFRQILILKGDIENVIGKHVDLITLSDEGIFLNQKLMAKKLDEALTILEIIIKETYSTFIISLGLEYLKHLFPNDTNILDLINKTFPKAHVFIFGANSVIKTIKRKGRVFLHPRHGVAKLTREFKNEILAHIKTS